MATQTSGSITTSAASAVDSNHPRYAKISWNAVFNETTLKWNVSWTATAQGGSDQWKWTTVYAGNDASWVVVYKNVKNGVILSNVDMPSTIEQVRNDTVLISDSFEVEPNADGSLSLYFHSQFQFYTSASTGTSSVEQLVTLPIAAISSTISLANSAITISSTSGTLGYTVTSKDNYYHNLYFGTSKTHSSDVLEGVQINKTTYSGTVNIVTILSMVPTKTGTIYFYLDTFRDANCTSQVGVTVTAALSVTVDTTAIKPSLSLNNITSDQSPISGYLIAGYSSGKSPNATAIAGSGSLIDRIEYTVTHGSLGVVSYSTAGTNLTFPLDIASTSNYTLTLRAIAYDKRGAASSQVAKTATVYGYALPVITTNIYRVDASGETQESSGGEKVRVNFSATQTKTVNSQNNTLTTTCTATGGITGAQTNNTYPTLLANNTATFTVTATDKVSSVSVVVVVNRAIFPLQLYDDLNGNVKAIFNGSAQFKNNDADFTIKTQVTNNVVRNGIFDETENKWTIYRESGNWIFDPSFAAMFVNACNEYTYDTTVTGSTWAGRTYTASGAGLVFISGAIWTDDTDDYGTTTIAIAKNNTVIERDANRLTSSSNSSLGSSVSLALKVASGDVLGISGMSSKTGTKYFHSNLISIGCTLTAST